MFALTLILILPGTFLPVALKSFFTADELMDMGVYLGDVQPLTTSNREPAAILKSNPSSLVTSLST